MKLSQKAGCCIAICVLMLCLLSGCAKQNDVSAIEVFLQTIYTPNENGRWEALQENGEAAEELYYARIAPMCTEAGLMQLKAIRWPVSYDRMAEKAGVELYPHVIEVEEKDTEGRFKFTIEIQMLNQGAWVEYSVECGELTVVQRNDKWLIDSFWTNHK